MRHGIVLFTSDRGIAPADLAVAAEQRGFDTIYVPEHTHIPVRREAAHPTAGADLPDDRYLRTLDPWVALATCATVTKRIGLSTAVALPAESDPITLAKTIATLDHLCGGRVSLGAGFGWNTDELADHGVPGARRRTVLKEYLEAMRALWTQDQASYSGEFVAFGPSWAYPKPAQAHLPVVIGAGGGPKTLEWIAQNADGWMTTPIETDIPAKISALRQRWSEAGRSGEPDVRILVASKPSQQDLADWAAAGASELMWGVPDVESPAVHSYLDRLALRLGLSVAGAMA
jgi:probable F420-dependent oxidoreductase